MNGHRTSLATSRSTTATVGSELNVVFGTLGGTDYCKAGSKLRTAEKVKVKMSCYTPRRLTLHIRSRH